MSCTVVLTWRFYIFFPGAETYENQLKYGKEVFQELRDIQENGFDF